MLTTENYFNKENQMKYWGVSQFKSFDKCQAMALAEVKGEWKREQTNSLLQGQYLDSYFDGTKVLFESQNKILQKNGSKYADFVKVDTAYTAIEDDPEMFRLATGQQQVIMTGFINGYEFKIAIDSLLEDEAIVDRKYVKDFEAIWNGEEKLPFWEYWGYDIQGAVYQSIYEQNTGVKLPFRLVCVTKEKVPNKAIFEFSQETLDNALERVIALIDDYDDVKNGKVGPFACGECDYCKSIKKFEKGEYIIL